MDNPIAPIHDDELLYRRIPASSNPQLYDPGSGLSPKAFQPSKPDLTGLSIDRARFHENSAERAAALGRKGKRYYIAVLRASDIRRLLKIEPKPVPGNPGHAELPELRYDNHRDQASEQHMMMLRNLCVRIEGPFDGEQVPDQET